MLSFVDLALGPDLPGPLPQLEAFRCDRANLEERCDELVATELHEKGIGASAAQDSKGKASAYSNHSS